MVTLVGAEASCMMSTVPMVTPWVASFCLTDATCLWLESSSLLSPVELCWEIVVWSCVGQKNKLSGSAPFRESSLVNLGKHLLPRVPLPSDKIFQSFATGVRKSENHGDWEHLNSHL